MIYLVYFFCAVLGYLLGCFSTGLFIANKTGVDIRKEGSKSTGATNVTRVLGVKHGLATFAGDVLKGFLAVALGTLVASRNGAFVAGLFTIIGHNWPVFYQFKGGKGIASSCAILLWLFPLEAAIAMLIAFLCIVVLRYVSVGSLVLLFLVSTISLFTRPLWPDFVFTLTLFLMGTWRHKTNIERLLKGTENKLTFKR